MAIKNGGQRMPRTKSSTKQPEKQKPPKGGMHCEPNVFEGVGGGAGLAALLDEVEGGSPDAKVQRGRRAGPTTHD
ncbi:hypothetical protein FXN63_25930 [Pigmentiphaga aceris]|uniref:Uncharacterized protein n=1 Tax=Pigmentiphaga aceris TaxID=1940612 RepID=A0A5C0B2V4_9BURK|nr:hypothetical protein [Pigmentiphaga aceris]QEI08912.1 hypothetical protein FXN63_25930 [Pigmentiphaga aceris]